MSTSMSWVARTCFHAATAMPSITAIGRFNGSRAVQTCFSARIKRSAGMGTHAPAEFFGHVAQGPIVFLHLPGVPLAIHRPNIAPSSNGALQPTHQKLLAGVHQVHPPLNALLWRQPLGN